MYVLASQRSVQYVGMEKKMETAMMGFLNVAKRLRHTFVTTQNEVHEEPVMVRVPYMHALHQNLHYTKSVKAHIPVITQQLST